MTRYEMAVLTFESLENFALTEAAYVTVRLMQEFQTLKSRDPEPWCEKLTITLAVGNGVKVSMIPR